MHLVLAPRMVLNQYLQSSLSASHTSCHQSIIICRRSQPVLPLHRLLVQENMMKNLQGMLSRLANRVLDSLGFTPKP